MALNFKDKNNKREMNKNIVYFVDYFKNLIHFNPFSFVWELKWIQIFRNIDSRMLKWMLFNPECIFIYL